MKILVTGGAGFIGSNFIKHMLGKYSYKIINYDKLTYAGNLENLKEVENNKNYFFVNGDITDEKSLRNVINKFKINIMINFAAETHVDRSILGAEEFVRTNVLGTCVLLNLAKEFKIERFIQISTDEVYGALGESGKFSESSKLSPSSPYSASKTSADLLCQSFFKTYGLPVIITRCSNNYGPYQFPEKLIPLIIKNSLENKQIPVYGDGKNIRDWIFVLDHCKAIDLVLHKGRAGEVYNIGGNCEKRNIEIVRLILKKLGKSENLITFVEDRPGHDWRYAIDSSKISQELGWKPDTSFEEGIDKTIKYYLDNPDWIKKCVTGEYKEYYQKNYESKLKISDEKKKCYICDSEIEPFISFGKMPLANGFLQKDQFSNEYFFELKVAFCPICGMVQLTEQPDKEKMFNESYPFFSGTSKGMELHFKDFADHVIKDYLPSKDPFVVEIGSNDGIMLKNFKKEGIRHLGVEPSDNVAQVARNNGIETISEFFDENCANKIVSKYGKADAFLGANVMCHIPYLHSIIKGIKLLLKKDGVVMFEDPYLGDVIEKTTFDQIYDEHVFLFSASSVKYLFEKHGMELINVEPQETHGGSMRYVIANKGTHKVSKRVFDQLKKEKEIGLNTPETYVSFRKNCEKFRLEFVELLNDLKRQGKKIVGYAATSKSTTIMNYCGITNKHIDFICDTTPIKQGKFSPGAHIPIRPYEDFKSNYPHYALLFAYNHEKEIMAKEQEFMKSGGKWITYVPKIQVR